MMPAHSWGVSTPELEQLIAGTGSLFVFGPGATDAAL